MNVGPEIQEIKKLKSIVPIKSGLGKTDLDMGLLKVCNSLSRQQPSGSLKNRLCNHLKEK